MKKTLIILRKFQYEIDLEFYKSLESENVEIQFMNEHPRGSNIGFTNQDTIRNYYSDYNILVIFDEIIMQSFVLSLDRYSDSGKLLKEAELKLNKDRIKVYFEDLPPSTHYIYFDNNGEGTYPVTSDIILEWLNLTEMSTYVISSRYYNLSHPKLINGLTYLPILFMFLQQNFKQFPMIRYSQPSNSENNFITYLGQTEKQYGRNLRYNMLNKIFKNDLTSVDYEEIENFQTTTDLYGPGKPGHYWNILNSLSAKIQIIFETMTFNPTKQIPLIEYEHFFFTEKIMKCFILPHPYLLIVNRIWLDELEKFGFKFHELNKAESFEDFEKIIENIKSDIDGWIGENRPYFEHNQRKLYEIGKSTTLPHHEFLRKIMTNPTII
jgi:hypothetical protein